MDISICKSRHTFHFCKPFYLVTFCNSAAYPDSPGSHLGQSFRKDVNENIPPLNPDNPNLDVDGTLEAAISVWRQMKVCRLGVEVKIGFELY